MKAQVCVVGSLNIDLVVRTPRMPQPGETIRGYDFGVIPGGKGANQAVAAARQGGDVTMIGRVGDDDFGRRHQRCLAQDHINTSYIVVDPDHPTGVAMITLDETGQNSIIIAPEANGCVTPKQIEDAQAAIKQADILLCQLETPIDAITRAIEIAYEAGVQIILNPAPAYQLEQSLLEKVTYLIPNETEAGLLTGIEVNDLETAKEAAEKLHSLGVKTVILTMGENGVLVLHEGTFTHEDAVPVKAVDTTAAGDSFVGSFAVALMEGRSVLEAVRFAKHAGALTVTTFGAQSSLPSREDVEKFMSA